MSLCCECSPAGAGEADDFLVVVAFPVWAGTEVGPLDWLIDFCLGARIEDVPAGETENTSHWSR